MPTVAFIDGIRIEFFFNEHPPPHFHAIFAGDRATIDIAKLGVLKGALPVAKLRLVREWATLRRRLLLDAWENCRNHEEPGRIG